MTARDLCMRWFMTFAMVLNEKKNDQLRNEFLTSPFVNLAFEFQCIKNIKKNYYLFNATNFLLSAAGNSKDFEQFPSVIISEASSCQLMNQS